MKTQQEIEKEISRINDLLDRKSTSREDRIVLNERLSALFWVLDVGVALANRVPTKD